MASGYSPRFFRLLTGCLGLVAVLALVFGFTHKTSSAPIDLFADGVESGDFSGWTSSSGSWTVIDPLLDFVLSPFEGSRDALIARAGVSSTGTLQKDVSTVGYDDVNLEFAYRVRTLTPLESNDSVAVEYTVDGSTWTNITTFSDMSTGPDWQTFSQALPAETANDPEFGVRFVANFLRAGAPLNADSFELDDVTITGEEIPLGSITIVKQAEPEDGTDFSFSFDDIAFSLDDDADETLSDTHVEDDLPVGNYTVDELVPDGWDLADIVCSEGTVYSHDEGETDIEITLGEGQHVTCTYTNVKEPEPLSCTLTAVSNTLTTIEELADAPAVIITPHGSWPSISGASWIWNEEIDETGSHTPEPETFTFTREFELDGVPTGATLDISADNVYSVSINGNPIGTDGDWANIEPYVIPAGDFIVGTNTLTVVATNEVRPDSYTGPNPGGLLYKLVVNGTSEEACVEPEPALSLEFGDAPAPYPTLLADDGARHGTAGLALGNNDYRDFETNGDPSVAADGDDMNGTDDEDGILFENASGTIVSSILPRGENATMRIYANNIGAYVDGWIDWNADGDWSDVGEQVLTSWPNVNGYATTTIAVPADATLGDTYARFRLSYAGGLSYTGAAPDGEVEDYLFTIVDELPPFDPLACEGNLLANGSFESPAVTENNEDWQLFPNGTPLLEWFAELVSDVTPGPVEIQSGYLGWLAADGEQYTELDVVAPSVISQDVTTVPGQMYRLTYKSSPRPDTALENNALQALVNGESLATTTFAVVGSNTLWQTSPDVDFVATTSTTRVSFKDSGATADGLGAFVDDVCLVPIGPIVEINECNDGEDNDNDGNVDYPADQSCTSYDDESEDSIDVTYGAYCGDGIVNQEWEQCDVDNASCTDQCQPTELVQCTDLVLARVVVEDFDSNEYAEQGDDELTSDIFLGGDLEENRIPSGTWFPVYDGGYITDAANLASYDDVPGLAIKRLNGEVRARLHGSYTPASVDDTMVVGREHENGYVEFWSWNDSVVPTSMIDYVVERPFNNNTSGNQDELDGGPDGADELADTKANFWVTVTLADDVFGTIYSEAPICLPETGTVSGEKWEDHNGNGAPEEGDQGLEGWTIYATEMSEEGPSPEFSIEALYDYSTTTDAEGNYTLELPEGNYLICEESQEGWTQTFPNDDDDCYSVTIEDDSALEDYDFGNHDDSEDGPEFVKVHIYKYLADDYGEEQVPNDAGLPFFPMVSTWTAENLNGGVESSGSYVLGNNEGGTVLDYAADTSDMTEGADYTTSEVTDESSMVLPIGASCEEDMFRLVGYRSSEGSLEDAQTAPLSETAPDFTDLQNDAYVIVVNEDCDDVLPPPTLTIVKNVVGEDDTFNFSLTGDTEGSSQISTVLGTGTSTTIELGVGTTTITELPTLGWQLTDSECFYDGEETGIVVPQGEEITVDNGDEVTCTFTNTALPPSDDDDADDGTVSGYKWNDLDNDGVWDEGEPALAGWSIEILGEGTPLASDITDSEGFYSITVSDGPYTLCEIQQGGWTQTFPNDADDCHDVTIVTDATLSGQNFGNHLTEDAPAPTITDNDNGGGGSSGSRNRGPQSFGGSNSGEVLGATTDTQFCPYLLEYLNINGANDSTEVNKAKAFFNSYLGLNLLLNGIFDQSLFSAVVDFQNMFKQDVLDTWVDEYPFLDDEATGYIYQTTLWKINSIVCPGYQTFPETLVIDPNA